MLPNLPTAAPAYPVLSDAKVKQLAAAYDTNSFMPERIRVELDENMAKALNSLAAHQNYIDQLAVVAKQTLVAAKDAATKADKKGKAADREAAVKVAFNAEKSLIKIAKLAKDDHQAFDGAWNEFRALNITSIAPKLPAEHLADFIRGREKLMADGKLINVKVAKMKQFALQATAITKMTASLAGTANQASQEQVIADALAAAKNLEAEFLKLMEKSMGSEKRNMGGGKNIGWVSVESKLSSLERNANMPSVPKQLYATSVQYQVNIQAAVKTYKATIKTMDTLGFTTLRTIPAEVQKSQAVAKALADAKAVHNEAKAVTAQAIKTLAEADKYMNKMKKKVA
jgi:hypothetical protein